MAELAGRIESGGKGGRLVALVIVAAIVSTAVLEASDVSVVRAITDAVFDLDTMIYEAANDL